MLIHNSFIYNAEKWSNMLLRVTGEHVSTKELENLKATYQSCGPVTLSKLDPVTGTFLRMSLNFGE